MNSRSPMRALLAHELVEPLAGHHALALGVGVRAMVVAERLAVEGRDEAHRLAVFAGTEHQMQVSGVEPVFDGSVRLVERRLLLPIVQTPVSAHWFSRSSPAT